MADTRRCATPSLFDFEIVTLLYTAPGYGAIWRETCASIVLWSSGCVPVHVTLYGWLFCPVPTQPAMIVSAITIVSTSMTDVSVGVGVGVIVCVNVGFCVDVFFMLSPEK